MYPYPLPLLLLVHLRVALLSVSDACLSVVYLLRLDENSLTKTKTQHKMARGQGKRERRGQHARMLQAVLLGAAMGSTSAFVPSVRPNIGSASSGAAATSAAAASSAGVAGSSSVRAMSNWGKVQAPRQRSSFRSRAVEAHGLQMVSAGVEKGMFTTSNPDDRRVTPETRDGKAYFKVSVSLTGLAVLVVKGGREGEMHQDFTAVGCPFLYPTVM